MNKKNFIGIIFIIAIIGGIIAFIYNYANNNSTKIGDSDYNSTRTSQNTNVENTNTSDSSNNEEEKNPSDENNNSEDNKQENNNDSSENNGTSENDENSDDKKDDKNSEDKNESEKSKSEEAKTSTPSKETEIASFTTKIYTKDSGRQKNIKLACSSLNNTTVGNGKTFSFSSTVGKATSAKGYKKADVFRDGDVIEALGGGLCQVSTTLYNAVLKVPNTKVTERHPHSNKVPYIKSGKDAAVSYGAYDFKFVNNTGNTLKIKASSTKNNVTIKLLKLE